MLNTQTEESPVDGLMFLPNTKCCTYTPQLPNFIVGLILGDESAEMEKGRASIRARMTSKHVINPLFLGRTIDYERRYMGSRERYFGRMAALRCPHYLHEEGGLCSIWRYREAVCSTYFCKHDRGSVGLSFWRRMREYLIEIEKELSLWCALSLGMEPKSVLSLSEPEFLPDILKQIETEEGESHLGNKTYRSLWGDWVDREQEYYIEAGLLVKSLDWEQISSLGGQGLSARAKQVEKACRALISTNLPDSVVRTKIDALRLSENAFLVEGYSPTDPVRISERLLTALSQFDGSPTEAVIERIRQQCGLKITAKLIRKLIDFGLLAEK